MKHKNDWKKLNKNNLHRRIDFAIACMRAHIAGAQEDADDYAKKEEAEPHIQAWWHQKCACLRSVRAYENAIRLIEDEYIDLPLEEKYPNAKTENEETEASITNPEPRIANQEGGSQTAIPKLRGSGGRESEVA